MKSIYNTNWFNVTRGLFYKNGVNLTFAVAIKHMIVFHENSEQGQHIPLKSRSLTCVRDDMTKLKTVE